MMWDLLIFIFAKAGAKGGVVYYVRMDKVVGPVSGNSTGQSEMFCNEIILVIITVAIFSSLEESIQTGKEYVNVHTDKFP